MLSEDLRTRKPRYQKEEGGRAKGARRSLDFYVEISEATGKNSNKQQKKNSYDKSRYIKKKIISG